MPRTQKATKTVDAENGRVEFKFATGEIAVVNLSDLPEAIVRRLALHGLSQKLGDTYAGDVANPQAEVTSLYAELMKGTWSQRAESGGPRVTLLAEAIAELRAIKRDGNPKAIATPDDLEKTIAYLESKSDEDKKTLRTDARIAAKSSEIQIRKAQAKLRDQRKAAGDAGELAIDF